MQPVFFNNRLSDDLPEGNATFINITNHQHVVIHSMKHWQRHFDPMRLTEFRFGFYTVSFSWSFSSLVLIHSLLLMLKVTSDALVIIGTIKFIFWLLVFDFHD